MGSIIDCFLLEPVNEVEESLRRFVFSDQSKCSTGHGYHNVEAVIGRQDWQEEYGRGADDFDHADSRWPKACACGYIFQPEDQWQHNLTRLYIRKDTGEKMTLSDASPGAMWFANWLRDRSTPDGNNLMVRTPAGDWHVDGKSTNGSGWTRTGVPPKVTATPSIAVGMKDGRCAYHGFLREGRLEEC